MHQYHDALRYILETGENREDRTGINTISIFGYQTRFSLQEGFPAVTTKKLAWKSVVSELLWFLEGSTDERRLAEIRYGKPREELVGKRTIWTDNADAQGKSLGHTNNDLQKELGPVYGRQWRNFLGADQIEYIIRQIKEDPYSRRIILSAWNPVELNEMALPPCHTLSQFYVNNGYLSGLLYQRSADMFLGVPFNIASYSLLIHIIAEICDLKVGEFIWTGGDCHIYHNHLEQVTELLKRDCKPLPNLSMPNIKSLNDVYNSSTEDYKLINYEHHPEIKAKMAI